MEGLLAATLSSFNGSREAKPASHILLQQYCLGFLSKVLDLAPIALQTLRASGTWDRLLNSDLFLQPATEQPISAALEQEGDPGASSGSPEELPVQLKIVVTDDESVRLVLKATSGGRKISGEMIHPT